MKPVLTHDNGIHRYLDLLPGGTELTVRTRAPQAGRKSNKIAVLVKELAPSYDWKAVGESKLEVKSFPDGAIADGWLAEALSNPDLWSEVSVPKGK